MKCKVRISSAGSNWKDSVFSLGELCEKDGGYTVSYKMHGDMCELKYSAGKVYQKRVGGQNIEMLFSKGEKTYCTLGSGAFSGGFDIFTNAVVFIKKESGFFLSLDYMSGDENIKLDFSVVLS